MRLVVSACKLIFNSSHGPTEMKHAISKNKSTLDHPYINFSNEFLVGAGFANRSIVVLLNL